VLAIAAAALLALPQQGILEPGKSLAGVGLGASEAQVRRAWGPRFGICRSCPRRTLYFTYSPFNALGVGVEFKRGRVIALYTLWSPPGWRTRDGVQLGTDELTVTNTYRGMLRTHCGHYDAFELRRGRASTVFWLRNGSLWSFGLQRPSLPVCR
jgi:hypothetical protein